MNYNELDEFCRRWLQKADSYDTSVLSGAFDSFWSTFVAYNALYNEVVNLRISRNQVKPQDNGDKRSATVHVPDFLGHANMAHSIKDDPESWENVNKFTRLIKNRTFYIHSNKLGEPNYAEDRKCLRDIEDGGDKEFCEALMVLIYKTRCNMFHGGKKYHPDQAPLLNPMTKILRVVINQVLALLRE